MIAGLDVAEYSPRHSAAPIIAGHFTTMLFNGSSISGAHAAWFWALEVDLERRQASSQLSQPRHDRAWPAGRPGQS